MSSKIIPSNPAPTTSYYRSIVTIGLSRTVSEINGDVRRKSNENRQFSQPRVFNAPADGVPLEFGIGVRGLECFYDGAIRWLKKFSDTFSRFDTILAVTDSQPASHVAVAITLNAKASSLKINTTRFHWYSKATF